MSCYDRGHHIVSTVDSVTYIAEGINRRVKLTGHNVLLVAAHSLTTAKADGGASVLAPCRVVVKDR